MFCEVCDTVVDVEVLPAVAELDREDVDDLAVALALEVAVARHVVTVGQLGVGHRLVVVQLIVVVVVLIVLGQQPLLHPDLLPQGQAEGQGQDKPNLHHQLLTLSPWPWGWGQ